MAAVPGLTDVADIVVHSPLQKPGASLTIPDILAVASEVRSALANGANGANRSSGHRYNRRNSLLVGLRAGNLGAGLWSQAPCVGQKPQGPMAQQTCWPRQSLRPVARAIPVCLLCWAIQPMPHATFAKGIPRARMRSPRHPSGLWDMCSRGKFRAFTCIDHVPKRLLSLDLQIAESLPVSGARQGLVLIGVYNEASRYALWISVHCSSYWGVRAAVDFAGLKVQAWCTSARWRESLALGRHNPGTSVRSVVEVPRRKLETVFRKHLTDFRDQDDPLQRNLLPEVPWPLKGSASAQIALPPAKPKHLKYRTFSPLG